MKESVSLALNPRESMRQMVEQAKRRLVDLNEIATSTMKTTGQFRWREGDETTALRVIDIFKVSNIKFLLNILGYLKSQQVMYETAAKEVNLTAFPAFTWGGYAYEAWKADITLRVHILTQKEEREKLEEVVNTMSKYLTEEDRMRNDLERIAGLMGVEIPPIKSE